MIAKRIVCVAPAVFALLCGTAEAGVIYSPIGATIVSGGPGSGDIADTYNHHGLETDFVSGVTDFDSYIATNPLHSYVFSGNEWFSNNGTNSADVIYDLGSVKSISKLALWNEESSGIGLLNLTYSTDGITFKTLANGLTPTDNPLADYTADVFAFGTVNARFINFDMSGCPQQNPGSYSACAIGEVAFNVSNVPLPASAPMFGGALIALGAAGYYMRRNKAAVAV